MNSDVFCDIRDAWIPLVNDLTVISAAGADFLIIEMPVFYFKIISLTGGTFSDSTDTGDLWISLANDIYIWSYIF